MKAKAKSKILDGIVLQEPHRISKKHKIIEKKTALVRANKELTVLNRLARTVTAQLSLQEACNAVVKEISHALKLEVAVLFLQEGDALQLKAIGPDTSYLNPETVPLHKVGECLCGLAAQTGRMIASSNIHKDKRCTWTECKQAGLHSFAATPLILGKQHIGVLGIASADHYDFRQAARFLKTASDQLVIYIQNAKLFEQTRAYASQLEQQITERKRSEKALRETEQKLRNILEHSNELYYVHDTHHVLSYVSPQSLQILGYSPEEMMIEWTRLVTDNPINENGIKITEKALKTGEKQAPFLLELFKKDRSKVLLEIDESPFKDDNGNVVGIVGAARDVTERKMTERELQESERKYRELVQNANSIILRWNRKGEITFLNEFGQKFFGYPEAEITGRHVVGTIVPETESTGRDLRPLMAKICANPEAFEKNINENMLRNGDRVWISWTNKIVMDDQGQVLEILSIGMDITEQKRTEEELEKYRLHLEDLVNERTKDLESKKNELERSQKTLQFLLKDVNEAKKELEIANERLKELDRLKSMFIASMSHELRTPLNSIIGFTGMTVQGLSGALNDEQKDNLTRVNQAAKHLLALITDVIDISKIEAGRIDSFPEIVSLKKIIDEAIINVEPQLNDKMLTLTVDVPADVDLNTDRKRLLQCLINLLSNGVKYTEKGGVTITALASAADVEISITDTGIGIDEKDMPKLFDAFERLETHLRVKAGGTGLGLYLTKKLATDILHGNISVQSRKGQGSTFTLRVPKDLRQTIDTNKW